MPSRAISPKASRSAGWARRRSLPTWPASSPPNRAHTSPAPPSMSMAAVPRWFDAFSGIAAPSFETQASPAPQDEVHLKTLMVRSAATPRVSNHGHDRNGSRKRGRPRKQKRPPSPKAFSLLNRVLGGLDWPCADDLPGRLGLEHHFFARER